MKRVILSLLLALTASAAMAGDSDYVELLTNGAPDGTFKGWICDGNGDGWAIKEEEDGTYSFVSSFFESSFWQTVDLLQKGMTAENIDKGQTMCHASAEMITTWAVGDHGAKVCSVTVEMLAENGDSLSSVTVLDDVGVHTSWTYSSSELFSLVKGTRKLKYIVKGCDIVYWLGYFGPRFRNLSLKAQGVGTAPEQELVMLTDIKSTGKQAFNTDYIHKANTKVVMDCNVEKDVQSDWEALFGARLGDYDNNAFCFFSRTDRRNIPCFNRSGDETRGRGFIYGDRISIVATGNTVQWYRATNPDVAVNSVNTTGTADDGKTPMLLFNLNTSSHPGGISIDTSPSVMTLYGCKIYEDETLVRDFVPAQKGNMVGLYDKVTGSFSGSITETPFESTEKYYNINVEYNVGGLVYPSATVAKEGDEVKISVTPDDGYRLDSVDLICDGNSLGELLPDDPNAPTLECSFKMPSGDVTVRVTFAKADEALCYQLNTDGKTLTVIMNQNDPEHLYHFKELVIPEKAMFEGAERTVTAIGNQAFFECKSITSVKLPKTIRIIDKNAFSSCTSLISINLPEGLEKIGEYAFRSCSSLKDIQLPRSLTTLESDAFLRCSSLTSVLFPNNITEYGQRLFQHCTAIKTVVFEEGVRIVPLAMFVGCTSLETVSFPSTLEDFAVSSNGSRIFKDCDNIKTIYSKIEEPFPFDGIQISPDDPLSSFTETVFREATLYVPKGTAEKYYITEGWRDFNNIVEEDIDGIPSVRETEEADAIYKQGSTIVNLAGQRLQKMQKGINIVGCKKVLVK